MGQVGRCLTILLLNGRRCRCGFLQAAQIAGRAMRFVREEERVESDLQIRGASLFGLVVVGAWDTEGDTMLARLLGVIGVLAGAAHLAGTARIAACGGGKGTKRGRVGRGTHSGTVAC